MPLVAMTREMGSLGKNAAAVPGVESVKNHPKTTAGSRLKDDY